MRHVLFNGSLPVALAPSNPFTGTSKLKEFPGITYDRVESRWDWKSMEYVEGLAMRITAFTGKSFIAVDNGECVSPRYDIMELPKVGDEVSYGFNGDYYPDGKIVSITKKFMIKTSTGNTYRRRRQSGAWLQPGGTWGLCQGHISEQNPHF